MNVCPRLLLGLLFVSVLTPGSSEAQVSEPPAASNLTKPANQPNSLTDRVAKQNTDNQNTNNKTTNNQDLGSTLDAGYLLHLRTQETNSFYYVLKLQGQTLAQKGTPFTTPIFPKPTPTPNKVDPGGDTHALSIRLEKDALTPTGSLFDALGVKPLPLSLGSLRGVVQVSGKFNENALSLGHLDYGVGLETSPLHPFQPLNERAHLGITNWLVFGVQGATQSKDKGANTTAPGTINVATSIANQNSTETHDVFLATYRSFFAVNLGRWNLSDAGGAARTIIENELTSQPAPDTKKKQPAANAATYMQLSENFLVGRTGLYQADTQDAKSDAAFKGRVNSILSGAILTLINFGYTFQIERNDRAFADLNGQDTSKTYDLDGQALLDELHLEDEKQTTTNDKQAVADVVRAFYNDWEETARTNHLGPQAADDKAAIRKYYKDHSFGDGQAKAVRDMLNAVLEMRLFRAPDTDAHAIARLNSETSDIGTLKTITDYVTANQSSIIQENLASVQQDQKGYASRLALQEAFPGIIQDIGGPDEKAAATPLWLKKSALAVHNIFLLGDRPTVTLWLAETGWYTMAGQPASPKRYNNLIDTALRYYLNPKAETRSWLEVQYQNGRDRAASTEYKNQVSLVVGFELK